MDGRADEMRFAVISDTHFFAPGRGHDGVWWNRALNTRTREIGERMVAVIAGMQPDFVIHCGDITGHCDMENWEIGLKVMEDLPCPWYGVIGNHETWFPGIRDAFSKRYELPTGQCYYTRRLGGLRFIFLDTCCWQAVDGAVSPYLDKELYDAGRIRGMCIPPGEIQWLREQLDAHGDETVCLVSHAPLGFKPRYPVATMPDGRPGREEGTPLPDVTYGGGKRFGDTANRVEVRRALAEYDNVKLAVAGHAHINDLYMEDGIAFIQTGAMREWPFEFRMIAVKDGVASVTTHGLSLPGLKEDSFLKERGNSWVAGEPGDREFSLEL